MTQPANAFGRHDHDACAAGGMEAARALCAERRLRLTPVRARVLEILLEAHEAMGAYEILDRLRSEGLGSQPPVVYRALEFLTGHGLAHRIEKLNAYLACARPGRRHAACFLICEICRKVAEIDDQALGDAIGAAAEGRNFAVERAVLELSGCCPSCREGEP